LPEYPQLHEANMLVAMDRILNMVDHAVDPQEQLDNLKGMKLGPDGSWYASTYDNYYIVTSDMKFDEFTNIQTLTPKLAKQLGIPFDTEAVSEELTKNHGSYFKSYAGIKSLLQETVTLDSAI